MTRQGALDLYMSVRYNLPSNRMKEAVDFAFAALERELKKELKKELEAKRES